jgi:protein-tyrosine phosphatase
VLDVLFVCTGNICRSPMAEGFLADRSARLFGGGIRVSSAGTWARTGNPATPESVVAAGERGPDIAGHRSSSFRGDLARRADLVLTMTEEQRGEVLEQVPEAEPRTFTFKELVALLHELPPPSGEPTREALVARIEQADSLRRSASVPSFHDTDVADPLGLSVEAYRAIAWEIEGLVDELLEGLVGRSPATRPAEATEA